MTITDFAILGISPRNSTLFTSLQEVHNGWTPEYPHHYVALFEKQSELGRGRNWAEFKILLGIR